MAVLVAVRFCVGCSRDSLNYRQSVLGRKVAISRRHDDGFVASEFLNLFDRRSRHRQPGTERMAVCVPDIPLDPGVLKNRMEP